MRRGVKRITLLIVAHLLYCTCMEAQLVATIPWSSSLNLHFGVNSPILLPPGNSDFSYVSATPYDGTYTVAMTDRDAGHLYFGPFHQGDPPSDFSGYTMLIRHNPKSTPKTVFRDTITNLCGNSKYLFWTGLNVKDGVCYSPSFTLSVETVTGTVIASLQTGDIGGPLAQDNYSWYPGFFDPTKKPPFPFYGVTFDLPAGQTEVVVKIIINASTANSNCNTLFQLDNILLMPVGPDIRISSSKYIGGYIAASCYQGNVPLELEGKIESGFFPLAKLPNYTTLSYTNPAFQWQQSLDDGYTWTDIPGETNINISHVFNNPDTFWVRLRVSEASGIGNANCSNISNVIKVQVEEPMKNFSLTTNSPVCTDGNLELAVAGEGASFITYGPNGFWDDSPYPHIHHPNLADSGWYYSEGYTFGGCKTIDSAYVQILGPPMVTKGEDRLICYSDTVHLHASGGVKYTWSPAMGLNNPTLSNPVASPLTTTTYEVKITDDHGCSDFDTVMVALRNGLLKAVFAGPDVVCPNDAVQFRDTSQGQVVSWLWSFGNGGGSNLKLPPVQYYPSVVANLAVSLTVTDTSGCTQTMEKSIRSVDNCYIAVPTAFTPNNDGVNDYLQPLNAYKATNLVFRVFSRNGSLVFMTRDWTRRWDGTTGGVRHSTGVYVWMLSYTDEFQKPVFLKGTVTLIR